MYKNDDDDDDDDLNDDDDHDCRYSSHHISRNYSDLPTISMVFDKAMVDFYD